MAGIDKDKAIKGGVTAGLGLLALVTGRGGIEEASQGVSTILEAAGVVSAADGKKDDKKPAEEKPLTDEQKQEGLKTAAAAIAREAGAALKG